MKPTSPGSPIDEDVVVEDLALKVGGLSPDRIALRYLAFDQRGGWWS